MIFFFFLKKSKRATRTLWKISGASFKVILNFFCQLGIFAIRKSLFYLQKKSTLYKMLKKNLFVLITILLT